MSAAGWYPDPSGAPGERYFNGKQWTDYHATDRRRENRTPDGTYHRHLFVLLLAIGGVALTAATDGQSTQEPELEAVGQRQPERP